MRATAPATAFALACLVLSGVAAAAPGSSEVAALQVCLRERGLYSGSVDGYVGPHTSAAIRVLQRRAGLRADGVPGAATRAALGRFGRAELGSRVLGPGAAGWDVEGASAPAGVARFPVGDDGRSLRPHLESAVRKFGRSR